MKNFIATLLLLIFFGQLFANSPFTLREIFQWELEPIRFQMGDTPLERWRFKGAADSEETPTLPWMVREFRVNSPGAIRVDVVSAQFESFNRQPTSDDAQLSERLQFVTSIERDRNGYYIKLAFVPMTKRGNSYERLTNIALRITHTPEVIAMPRGPLNARQSVLRDGDIYKFAISETGMYKLTYDFLRNRLGISNIDNIDPRDIKIYGNGGGMLPHHPEVERPDDLIENHIIIVGEEDGRFNTGDYILLYAQGPDSWHFNTGNREFVMEKNIYDTRNYYFLKISAERGARVATQPAINANAYNSNTFNDFARFEQDRLNLLYEWGLRESKAQGSGQRWFGDLFRVAREYTYNNVFSFPNFVSEAPVRVRAEMALRAPQASRFTLLLNGQSATSGLAGAISPFTGFRNNETNYTSSAVLSAELSLTDGASMTATVRYPNPGGANDGSEGWLDYFQVNVRRRLLMTGQQMTFRDVETLAYPNTTFQLSNANANLWVWDISDPLQPRNQEFTLSGGTLSFGAATGVLRTFVAFDRNQALLSAEAVGKIANQNLHNIEDADMVLVYHPAFRNEALQLAEHRTRHSKFIVFAVSVEEVYNEFASGRTDPAAIRDFAKMLYERSERFHYLLLFGDGSFDNRDLYGNGGNFIPTYQTDSMNPIFAFPADDYYGIFYGTQLNNPLAGRLNIAVGRLPVKTAREAQAVVNKIIHYDTSPITMSDWRNRLTFVADDEDNNQHINDADRIADMIWQQHPFTNVDKIYLDAFPQVIASGGQRFPAAKEEINRAIFRGTLAMTYLGHGGERGWAQERVLEISDILNWNNMDQLPLFLTATCSFTGFDNPLFTSAGEETFLNPRGGAIALLTTVRAVFANQNAELTEATMRQLFSRIEGGRYPSLGTAMINAKNGFSNQFIITNSRKFALIGDPALQLAIPTFGVRTARINTQEISELSRDTIRALQRVTVEGVVTDLAGQPLNNFNGIVYPLVFDKPTTASTLAQDLGSRLKSFLVQRNIIFKGRASVRNGAFSFTFVVPKDINYQFGEGKISYYAADERQMIDATGNYNRVIIGGTDASAFADTQGPEVNVYMNTEDFIFGSITNANPTLLVRLRDDNGINVVGNSIGHDLEAVLNNNTQNTFLLNDFYEAELDDYTRGIVRYPLFRLPEGRHEIRVTAWDVANNPAQGYTEFIVAESGKVALERVLNYPNPFTDRTCFQFDHNLANQELDVRIQIFTISGRLVKTIQHTMFSDGAIRLGDCIEWDGRDDFGDRLARGVYLYKVKIRAGLSAAATVQGESKFEKLVILK